MLHEDLRFCHEDIERLEQAIADRALDDPKHIRHRLVRDHEIANFLQRIQGQSERALKIYNEQQQALTQEIQQLSTGDPLDDFYKQLDGIRDFHKRYPNEPVENLERAYKKPEDGGPPLGSAVGYMDIHSMFTGEEAWGRFWDLTTLHDEYLNLPGVKGSRKPTYLQYLDIFDQFTPPQNPMTTQDKLSEQYFSYVGSLVEYLEQFLRQTKPLEDLQKMFDDFDAEFEKSWTELSGPGSEGKSAQMNGGKGPTTEGTGEGIWCADCELEYKSEGVYKGHLNGKKHKKTVAAKEAQKNGGSDMANGNVERSRVNLVRLRERVVAEREHKIKKLAACMQSIRHETRINVERKAGMTDKERQQELQALYDEDQEAMMAAGVKSHDDEEDDEGEEKVYNPLKLPLAWDGKPIPFWLYKLHGLGVEFPCEICGNYVYMGRRAFDKHFSEARHIYGLKCLGITSTGLFREITGIEEALKLWEKISRDKDKVFERKEGVVEMEDSEGNVMPQKVYEDLAKQGLL